MTSVALRLFFFALVALASSNVYSAKTCTEVNGKDYPCCCVIGNTGTCESKKACDEISGTCVPQDEHFRCTAGQTSRAKPSWLVSESAVRSNSNIIHVQDRGTAQRGNAVPPPLSLSITPYEARKRAGCPRNDSRLIATACAQFPDREPKQSEITLLNGSLVISEKYCYSIWYSCEYDFPKDFEPATPWGLSSRARIGRGNAPSQDDYCTTMARSVRNETLIQDEKKRAACLADHGCEFKVVEGGARLGAVTCPDVSLERKRDLIERSQAHVAANFGKRMTVTRFIPYQDPKPETRVSGGPSTSTTESRNREAKPPFKSVTTRTQVNPSSIWIFAQNPNTSGAKCSINVRFSYSDFGTRRSTSSTAEPRIGANYDGVMHNISGAYVDIQLEGQPEISCGPDA